MHTAEATALLSQIITTPGALELPSGVATHDSSDALLAELISRCEPVHLDEAIDFQVRVTDGELEVDYHLRMSDEAIEWRRGVPSTPWARLDFTLRGLADALFGNPAVAACANWAHHGLQKPTPDKPPQDQRTQHSAFRANHALLEALQTQPPSLEALAGRFGTDKWGLFHWYTPHYEKHFRAFVDQPVRLLEIGIGGYSDPASGGESLRMWQQYFRRGSIYGLDIYDKSLDVPRVHTIQGDQGDHAFMDQLGKDIGPLDLVIDDGSHLQDHVLTSFRAVFPHLRNGGIYVVEDLEPSYWPGWGGGPPTEASHVTGGIGFLKTLIDGLNHREFDGGEPTYLDRNVRSLHFYHNIAFIVKGPNRETGAPEVVRTMPPSWFPPN